MHESYRGERRWVQNLVKNEDKKKERIAVYRKLEKKGGGGDKERGGGREREREREIEREREGGGEWLLRTSFYLILHEKINEEWLYLL